MRIKFILLLSFIFVQAIHGQSPLNKVLDFSVNEISVSEALQELSKVAEVDIAFSSNFFDKAEKISVQFENQNLEYILSAFLKNTNVEFKVLGNRILLFINKAPEIFTISGYIEDKNSGERLIAATVFCNKNQKGTTTNEYGFYSLSLPAGKIDLQSRYLGFQKKGQLITLNKNVLLTIKLESNLTLPEVIVHPERKQNPTNYHVSRDINQLDKKFIEANPGLGGEEDFVRTSQLLPGIQGGVDGLGGLQVRGGESGQNLMLMDGVPVYIPYHLFGVYSVYNSSTINSSQLLKGTFSARYGGRLSSVYDIRIKEGNKEAWHGEAGINLINGKLLVEGPILKGKGSVLMAGRYAPNGFLLNPEFKRIYFQLENEEGELNSTFNDFNIKMNYSISDKDHLYLSMFSGTDAFFRFYSEKDDEEQETWNSTLDFDWDNTIGMLRWNHLFNKKLFSNTTVTYSAFSFNNLTFEEIENDDEEEEWFEDIVYLENQSKNADIGIKTDFDFIPNPIHTLRFGAALSRKDFNTSFVFLEEDDEEVEDIEDFDLDILQELTEGHTFSSIEASVYAEDQIQLNTDWYANFGLRGSSFFGGAKKYINLEPRLTLKYQHSSRFSVYTSVNRMVQYLHLVTNAALRLPNDLWIPSGDKVLPSKALQTELGVAWKLGNKFDLNIDAYYKKMNNLLAYPDNRDFLMDIDIENPATFLTRGKGETYGIEIFLKYTTVKTQAGVSYVLSKSERQYADQNLGASYPHEYDQRHQIKLFFHQSLGKRFLIGANWVYNSPNPQWALTNTSLTIDNEIESLNPPGQKNKLRSVPYHRVDFSFAFKHQSPRLQHLLKLGVYNLSNRQNAVFYYRSFFGNNNSTEPINGFPLLPSLSYSLKF